MSKKREWYQTFSFKLSWMVLMYFACILILFHLFKLVKLNNALGLVQTLSIALPIMALFGSANNKKTLQTACICTALYLVLCLGFPFIFGRTYDLTVDGNTYHKIAIKYLENNWNPLYESSENFEKRNHLENTNRNHLWVDHYPKATWIIASTMYHMTGYIESGKCITVLLLITMGFLSFSFLSSFLNKKQSFILSVLLALNPIVLAQLFNFYVDGIMGMCFVMELILLFMISFTEKQNIWIWSIFMAVCTIFVNLKFTGLLYSGIIAAVFYFYWLYKYRKEKNFIKYFKNITLCFTITFSIAIFLVGSSSYVRNTVVKHNPLYPLIGKDKVDIITTMQPKIFNKISMPQKFVWSMFSKTENVTYNDGKPTLKNPFRIYQSELDGLTIPDIRIAGFGPWSALYFMLGIFTLVFTGGLLYRQDKEKIHYILLPTIAIIISAIAVGENWWARYVPQLYLFPWMALVLLCYIKPKERYKPISMIVFFTIATVMFINSWFFIQKRMDEITLFKQIRNELVELKTKDEVELKLTDRYLYGIYYTLDDMNIHYVVNNNLEEDEIRYIYYWKVQVKKDA